MTRRTMLALLLSVGVATAAPIPKSLKKRIPHLKDASLEYLDAVSDDWDTYIAYIASMSIHEGDYCSQYAKDTICKGPLYKDYRLAILRHLQMEMKKEDD